MGTTKMKYDYSRLNGRIVEKFGTRKAFAAALNLSEHSLSLKLNNRIPFKQSEMERSCELLEVPIALVSDFFYVRS